LLVFGVDLERLGERADALTWPTPQGLAMRLRDGHCAALGREAASAPAKSPVAPCTIHAERPDCCRWLEPGSSHCRAARRRRGLD
jgi:hypothetical protein